MFKDLIFVDGTSKYVQIADHITKLIEDGMLIEGTKLPSSRELSSILGVGRNTIVEAYGILEEKEFVETLKGKGTFVLGNKIKMKSNWHIDWNTKTNRYAEIAEQLDIVKSEDKWKHGMISFKSISPPGELFDMEEFKRAFLNRISIEEHKILNYGYAIGYRPFLQYLNSYMIEKGACSKNKDIIVTNGFTEGLDMLLSAFTKPGNYILCENPTHNTALKIMKTHELNIIGVDMMEDGLDIDDLEKKIKDRNIKFAYLIPSYHNPTGVVMSISKRNKAYNILRENNIPIIEDGFNEELIYESSHAIPLTTIDGENNGVIYLGSYSKILFPGLRIGWIYGDKRAIEILESVKRCRNIHTSFLDQGILYEFLKSGAFEKYIKKVRRVYKEKYEFTKECIEKNIKEAEIWGEGGLHMFLKIKGIDTRQLLRVCYEKGVIFMPGDVFYINREENSTLRLGFTRLSYEEIEKGIEIIKEALETIKKQQNCGKM